MLIIVSVLLLFPGCSLVESEKESWKMYGMGDYQVDTRKPLEICEANKEHEEKYKNCKVVDFRFSTPEEGDCGYQGSCIHCKFKCD